MASLVIFLPTTKFAVAKSTSDIFVLPILANKPLLSSTFILVTPNANVVVVFCAVGRAPLHIPVMLLTAANEIDPSLNTSVTLLNLSTVSLGN